MANTGIGMRGWLEAAEGWGLAEPLRAVLAGAYIVARGPKARGAIRAAGLHDQWSPESESCDEVLDAPAAGAAWPGSVIAVQLHGERQPECTAALGAAGAEVIEVPVYRWAPPTDPAPLHRLVDLIAGRLVDAVTFTSAPAVEALLRAAGDRRRRGAGRAAHRRAGRLRRPGHRRAAAAARGAGESRPAGPGWARWCATIVDELPRRAVDASRSAGHLLTLRGHAAVVDGELRPAGAGADGGAAGAGRRPPAGCCPGRRCCGPCPGARTSTPWRWRSPGCGPACARPGVVQTVVKRGYRLRVD